MGWERRGNFGCRRFRSAASPVGWSRSLDEANAHIVKAEFAQFGFENGAVARIIHETEVILELGIEADGKCGFVQCDRMRFKEISFYEWAGATDCIEELGPELFNIGIQG
jgi:hypothetical protein